MHEVYGCYIDSFLESVKKPNSRLYVRVNTLKASVEDVLEEMRDFKKDEDFEEAIYTEVKGPNKLEMRETKVIVDKRTAESVMVGADAYRPGIKRVEGKGKEVSVISDNGVHVGNGILVRDGEGFRVRVLESIYTSSKISESKPFLSGKIYSQGKASMHVARILDPQPNDIIVDMTAAPGGKLSHVYQLQPKARIIGFDHTEKKIQKMRKMLEILGVKAELYAHDSRYASDFNIRADKVLIDPPCSAMGVRPKLYDTKQKTDIMNFHSYQRQFLNSAYSILKDGGEVVYSTCTVTTWENEKVIDDSRFELEYMIRFHPNVHDTTGFFIAKLKKK
ncbi:MULTISPECIES: RsmB/NOP family class I SAM-dependent RNA methyltransferase [Acidianus]|uniref:tRNA (cytosine(72)-C(5))-methyltransferase n=1 Tax=Candidatus Acidianus copahuensis TaxID=1160895 RepID=A0A031LMN2_9CREN|nr:MULTISPECIES: RsmB/NOP family class I SAM-dependent RNA methyltransferase [Acidianus]EZQ06883.1 SAM-dependent methlyltransferase [Candidatus Acidianus copahuensis]